MGLDSRRSSLWFAAAGLLSGLAMMCRPHLGLVGGALLLSMVFVPSPSRRRSFVSFAIPFAIVGMVLAAYNFARFGNPFEFGVRYLLAGANQNRIRLAAGNVLPGLYFFGFCAPDFSPVFPWVRLAFRYPFDSPDYAFPPGYVIEGTVGALYLAPFVLAAFLVPRTQRRVRVLLWAMLASSVLVLLFLAATGWTTQRYEVDFLPLFVLAALVNIGIYIGRSRGVARVAFTAVAAILLAYSVAAGLALGITGPYDEMAKARPARYLRIASWFSPLEELRPAMNPRVAVEFTAGFTSQFDGFREPLLTMGHLSYRYFLYAEHLPGKLRLISRSENSTRAIEIEDPGRQPVAFRVTYSPESGTMTTTVNGKEALVHEMGDLMTAPAQATVGENRIDPQISVRRFTGAIHVVKMAIETVPGISGHPRKL